MLIIEINKEKLDSIYMAEILIHSGLSRINQTYYCNNTFFMIRFKKEDHKGSVVKSHTNVYIDFKFNSDIFDNFLQANKAQKICVYVSNLDDITRNTFIKSSIENKRVIYIDARQNKFFVKKNRISKGGN